MEHDVCKEMDVNTKLKCRYCHRMFARGCARSMHERTCKNNPHANPHRKDVYAEYVCKYCGRIKYTRRSSNTAHEMQCVENPNRIPAHGGKHWNDVERKQISLRMKLAIKEGRAHGWANTRENIKGMSYPEQWFSNMIKQNGIDTGCEYNKQFYKYKLDFAWPDRRVCIEIDGDQHYIMPEQHQSDLAKDELLQAHGWRVLRLKWGYIRKNTNDAIKIVMNFLSNSGDTSVPMYKTHAERRMERRTWCMMNNVQVDKNGRYHHIKLNNDVWEQRKMAILECNVDLTKYGWVTQIIRSTGMSKRIIENTVKRFPEEFAGKCFCRNVRNYKSMGHGAIGSTQDFES